MLLLGDLVSKQSALQFLKDSHPPVDHKAKVCCRKPLPVRYSSFPYHSLIVFFPAWPPLSTPVQKKTSAPVHLRSKMFFPSLKNLFGLLNRTRLHLNSPPSYRRHLLARASGRKKNQATNRRTWGYIKKKPKTKLEWMNDLYCSVRVLSYILANCTD